MEAKLSIEFGRIYPVLRIFSEEKAREFYVQFLGCTVDFEHRFEPNLPLFMQVKRDNLILRLSEHHGDGSPGANITVETQSVDSLCKELLAKQYKYAHPAVKKTEWGTRDMTITDPFGNRITFSESAT